MSASWTCGPPSPCFVAGKKWWASEMDCRHYGDALTQCHSSGRTREEGREGEPTPRQKESGNAAQEGPVGGCVSIGGWNGFLDCYLQRSRVEEICAALGAHRVHVGLLVRREADVLHVVRELLGHYLNQTRI